MKNGKEPAKSADNEALLEQAFPAVCHLKVIGSDEPQVKADIQKALQTLDFEHTLKLGNRSAGGKYVTYVATVVLESAAQLREVQGALKKVSGVKIVL